MKKLLFILLLLCPTIASYATGSFDILGCPYHEEISDIDLKGPVETVKEYEYKATFSFGDANKGELIDSIIYTFNPKGSVVKKFKKGVTYKYIYNASGQLTKVDASDGSYYVYEYNAAGKIMSITRKSTSSDKINGRYKWKYLAGGKFEITEYDSSGDASNIFKGLNGRITSCEGKSTTTYTYAPKTSRVIKEVTRIATYLQSVTIVTTMSYNAKGLLSQEVIRGAGRERTIDFKYEYDTKGNWIRQTKNISDKKDGNITERIIKYSQSTSVETSKKRRAK